MKVLVTGAAGLTGGATVRALVAQGHDVIGLVRRADQAALVTSFGSRPLVADCRDEPAMSRALAGVDGLVHVAGIHLAPDLARAVQRSPDHVVVVSTSGIRSRHRASVDVYARGEAAVQEAFPHAVLLRPTMIYGSERDRNIHHVIALADRLHVLPLFGPSTAKLQPVHFEDLALAITGVLGKRADRPVDVGGGDALSIRDLASAIFHALGLPPRFVRLPMAPSVVAARVVDRTRGWRLAERLLRMEEDRTVDNTRIVELAGLEPRAFAQGVSAEVLHLRSCGALRHRG